MARPPLVHTPEWKALEEHYARMKDVHLRDLFSADPRRFEKFSLREGPLLLDYSKNIVTEETCRLLAELARASGVKEEAERMFAGGTLNVTEGRAVLHTALRSSRDSLLVGDTDVMALVREERDHMRRFSEEVRAGTWKGATGRPITDVVNIGIGGSHLGPWMVCEALKYYADGPRVHFVSNVDGSDISGTLAELSPETTLFLVASKTFTTQETMTNAWTARKWVTGLLGEAAVEKHFVALSANPKAVEEFGIPRENMFAFWDFVGGRYSLWSVIGMPVVLSIGYGKFSDLLAGGEAMDLHFLRRPLEENIPVVLAMLGIWYNNFFGWATHAVIPYDYHLRYLPMHLQQCDMESNGKSVDREGERVAYHTGPVVWGQPGTDGQHAFFQLLHQGTRKVPADFIGFVKPLHELREHHRIFMANFFAQTEALAFGRTRAEARKALLEEGGIPGEKIDFLAAHKTFEGNRPTNSILVEKLTPRTLGMLIAMYEHKIFTQGIVWRINSFDQMGVELGKKLAGTILAELREKSPGKHDSSTTGLMKEFLEG